MKLYRHSDCCSVQEAPNIADPYLVIKMQLEPLRTPQSPRARIPALAQLRYSPAWSWASGNTTVTCPIYACAQFPHWVLIFIFTYASFMLGHGKVQSQTAEVL